MDPITHVIFAYCLVFWIQRFKKIPLKLLIPYLIGSVIPDLDFAFNLLTYFVPKLYWLEHRGMTHSLVGVVPIVLIVAAVLNIPKLRETLWKNEKYSELKFWSWEGIVALYLGSLVHLLLDFFVPTGMMLFFPFSFQWYGVKILSTNNIHSIIALLAAVTFWPLKWNKRRRTIALSLFIIVFTTYSSVRVASNIRSANIFAAKYGEGSYSSNELIFPYNINYNIYNSTDDQNKTYIITTINGLTGEFIIEDIVPEISFQGEIVNSTLALSLVNISREHAHYYRLWQKNNIVCATVRNIDTNAWMITWFAPIREAEKRVKIGSIDYMSSTEVIFHFLDDGSITKIIRPFSV